MALEASEEEEEPPKKDTSDTMSFFTSTVKLSKSSLPKKLLACTWKE